MNNKELIKSRVHLTISSLYLSYQDRCQEYNIHTFKFIT